MKELEKTQRISIAAVLTILAVLIALISFKRPKHLYDSNTKETLAEITSTDYTITQDQLDPANQVLIDVRNRFDYDRGHLENAISIDTPELLSDDNSNLLNDSKDEGKTIVLYGNYPSDAVTPYMILTQLGFDNVKILSVANSYNQNKLITKDTTIESSVTNISAYIKESVEKTEEIMKKARAEANVSSKSKTSTQAKPTTPKTVVPVKKKKKAPVEGGC